MKNYKKELFGNEGVWRNDDHPEEHGESPTVSMFITHSLDEEIAETEHYCLAMRHVRGFHGKGFMPTLRWKHSNNSRGNGNAFYGTGQEAYDKALVNGQQMMERQEKDLQEQLERDKKAWEEHQKEQEND